ncbi:group 3 secretory phospholipase A2-like [Periophthalmus magnuspinnatus]|uniref:group 3 secretory phospholipase A2-like n=1 Tax=Periophthalmus magnuspinnatus TaxID=409849 RepID=UPI0024366575|nr:group 3 secretory phospholipase A2-like [Periophthalmus magnuspinnatus]
MQVRWVAFIHNVIALQTLVKCKLQNVMEPGTISCLTESYFGQGRTQVMFLREERGLLLYVTLWSEDMRLLACQVMSNPLVIENYRASYNRSSGENEPLYQRFNLSVVLSPNAPCGKTDAPKGERSRAGGEAKGRTKRSWLFPGTLWCGSGSKALGYDELGMFEGADRCCREHDHCPHIIPGFTVDYGVFNPNFFSVSHCDCDQRFRQCLLDVNDTISSMVHYSFFKILKVPCIELKLQTRCTEMYWWGMCKVTQEAPYAIFKRPIYYNTSFTSKYKKSDSSKSAVSEGHQLTEVHETEPSKKKPRQEEKCLSKDPPRGDTFVHKKTNGCRQKSGKLSTVAPYLHTTLLNTDISKTKALKTLSFHRGVGKNTNPYLRAPSTTPTTTSSQRPASKLSKAKATTTKSVTGKTLQKVLLFQNKAPLTSTVPAVTSTKGSLTTKWMFITNLPKSQTRSQKTKSSGFSFWRT